jgi:hypothetical protein
MGRKHSRKQERRWQQKGGGSGLGEDRFAAADTLVQADYELLISLQARSLAQHELACGSCREFIEDDHGGRGECLHPGSGVLLPWPDTPACPFHTAIR